MLLVFAAGISAAITLFLHWRKYPPDWQSSARQLSQRRWEWWDAVCIIGAIAFISFGILGILRLFHIPELRFNLRSLILQTISTHGVILAYVIAALALRRNRWRDAFGGGSERFIADIRRGIFAMLAATVIVGPVLLFNRWLMETLGVRDVTQKILEDFAGTGSFSARLYFAMLAVLIAPAAEEMLFRGIMFPVLLRRLPVFASTAIVSALFAGIHFHLPLFLPLFAFSICLCTAYLATGSIIVPITMHALFNATTTAIILVTR